jgi:homoserine kinase type II
MILSKKDLSKIVQEYNLGELKKSSLIDGGLVNHNYKVQTSKGNFLVRLVLDDSSKKTKHLNLQFKLMRYLQNKGFPYKIPAPTKSLFGKEILQLNNKKVWVCKFFEGKNFCEAPTMPKMKEMAKVLAIYHNYVKGLKGHKAKDEAHQRIRKGFKIMGKIKGSNPEDKLARENLKFFKEIYEEIKNFKCTKNMRFIHGDFDASNVLFQGDKIIAVIDFDEINFAPRIFDISVSIRDSCITKGRFDNKKAELFLEEYEKISKLEKEEKGAIMPSILLANVDFFVWSYCFMKKERHNTKKYMNEMLVLTKDIVVNRKVMR